MKSIIAMEPATKKSAFGAVVPNLPGCFSAGEMLDEAIQNAQEAIDSHCETLIEDNLDIPPATSIAKHQKDPEFAGWIWALVDVPVEKYLGPAEKINITVPRLILSRIDEYAKGHGATRSGFLVQAARQAMAA